MEEHNIIYFRNLWQSNIRSLEDLCEMWENTYKNDTLSEEVHDEIRTTVGLAKLLMNQKLNQFKGLMDDSEFKTGEKEITCIDLEGFWDMVFHEVEKIQRSFNNLDKCKSNGWKFVEENPAKLSKKKIPTQKVSAKVDSSKPHILAARQRLAEAKKKMLAQHEQKEQNCFQIIHPSTENYDNIKVIDKMEAVCCAETPDVTEIRKSNSKTKQSPYVRKNLEIKPVASSKESLISNDTFMQQSINVAVVKKGKENFVPGGAFKINNFSKSQMPDGKRNAHSDKNGKTKELVKLQCVTRAQRKALLAEQNF